MPLEQVVIDKLKKLSTGEQLQVLNFIEHLEAQPLRLETNRSQNPTNPESYWQAAQKYIGCVDGPEDLSINPQYIQAACTGGINPFLDSGEVSKS